MSMHRFLLASLLACSSFFPAYRTCQAAEPLLHRRTAIVEVADKAKGAVVNLHSERTVQAQPASLEETTPITPSQSRINGMGTGIVIDHRGYIITNNHVVEEVATLKVKLADGSTTTAKVVARDADQDLALLKLEITQPQPVMPLGTASDLMIGETVVAIGNAYGYPHTVTTGVVSANKRDVTLNKEMSYKSLVQTDACINPGNSGGPLLNVHGELIGVNVAIRAGAQGIGFAIPVDTMILSASEMLSSRRKAPLHHGLVCKDRVDVHQEGRASDSVGTSHRRSLVIEQCEANSPASKAGILPNDVLLQIDNQRITNSIDLERALLERSPGDKINVLVKRGPSEIRTELQLQAGDKANLKPTDLVWKKLGLKLNSVGPEIVQTTNPQLHGGLTVSEVRGDSVAGKAGIKKGDILVGLHQWEMLNIDNVVFVLTHPELSTFTPVRFYLVRAGQVHRGWLNQVD